MTNFSPIAEKSKLRAEVRRIRQQKIEEHEKTASSFSQHLLETVPPETGTIAAFLPIPGEPPIKEALAQIYRRGIKILVPIVATKNTLEWVYWSPGIQHPVSSFGIEEPSGQRYGSQLFYEADLHLIPALAFDTAGYRLGQGGGYYDRLLTPLEQELRSSSYIGIIFEEELRDKVPAQDHDAQLSFILTEKGLRATNRVE